MKLLPPAEGIDERKLWTLLAAMLALFLFYPIAGQLGILRFHRLAFALVLLFATYSVSTHRSTLKIAAALAAPAMLAQVASITFDERPGFIVLALALSLAFLLFVCLILVQSVFRSGEITADRIAGAIDVYLLAGLIWAFLYGIVEILAPGSFKVPADESGFGIDPGTAEIQFVYFSFVTVTTLGYGDISPLSAWAKTLSWLQAVFGQLYIAILLARLVSLHVAKSRSDDARDGKN